MSITYYLIWNNKTCVDEDFTKLKRPARQYTKSSDHTVWELVANSMEEMDALYFKTTKELENKKIPSMAEIHKPVTITRTRTQEHNDKISKKMTGRALSPQHKDAISDAMRGNSNRGS